MVVTLHGDVVELHTPMLVGGVQLQVFRDERDAACDGYGSASLRRREQVGALELDRRIPATGVEKFDKRRLHGAIEVRIDGRESETEISWLVAVACLVYESQQHF